MLALTTVDGVAHAEPKLPQQDSVLIALPEPSGAEAVGVVDLHMVDTSRRDPYEPAVPRELMVSIWYPAADVAGAPARPWLSPRLVRIYANSLAQLGASTIDRMTFAPSHGHLGAPAQASGGPRPIVVFSPGKGMPRELSTAHVEDLASHGFVVVTLSHTHESSAVEFPDGRIERSVLPPTTDPGELEAQGTAALATRVADTRFVLDKLADITAGSNPDADQRPLPANLDRVLDMSKVGMFGHSLGGATAAQAMHDDRRIAAAADLDGRLWGSVVSDGLDRPFMLINREGHERDDVPSWKQFWANDNGPTLNFRLNGAHHQSFCDSPLIAAALVAAGLVPAAVAAQMVGTIDPRKSLDVQRDYLRGFFDTALGRYDELTRIPATLLHPEMVLVP
ncbi:alpha/beta hydrolase family protein [Nocardia sp. NPDC058633]|uniref:alpha/beta hydrolase family protein n=1 Tax=Nocardia sp. NPDC058633 TaxID=3346568 RepID=UPI003660BB1E